MKLSKYIKTKRGLAKELADEIGSHAPDVHKWADGTRPIPLKFGTAIEIATKGKVTRKDLFPEDWESIWPELKNKAA